MTQTIKNLAVLVAVLAFAFTMKAEVNGSAIELPHTYKVLTENGQPVWEWEGHSKASLVLVCIIHPNKKEYVTTEDIACELVTAPTASSAGVYAYTAKVEYQNKEYTSTIYEEIADAPVNIMVPAGTTLNLFEDGSDGVITGCITISGNLNMGGGAICNPDGYAIIVEDGGSVTFYSMSNASATSITLNAITSGTIAAGTPVIYNRGESVTSLSINKDQKTLLKSTSTDGSSSNGLTLKGTFEQTSIDSGYYLDAVNGKVCSAATYSAEHNGGKVTIPAFRAWFDGSIPSEAKALDINIAESITSVQALHDAISGNVAIYDSNGQRLNNLRKGLNIVKYNNGETKKIIVK